MRQYRMATPSSPRSILMSKYNSDSKKASTCAGSQLDISKIKSHVISANASPTLKKLKKLRSRTTTNSVSPSQAAIIVKDYIMPMFKLERDAKHIRRRSEVYGNKGKPSEFKESGMISDFKLVQDLNLKLEELKEKNKDLEDELKQAKQDKMLFELDFKGMNDKLLNAEGNMMFLNFNYTQAAKKASQEKFGISLTNKQLYKYKSLYEEEVVRSTNLGKMLDEEKAKTDRIKHIAVKLEYINTLLVMENDIIGEKLKGLYMSLDELLGNNSVNKKLIQEYSLVAECTHKLSNEHHISMMRIGSIQEEKKELEVLVKELSDITLGIQDRKDKYIKMLRDKYNKLESELKQAMFNKEKQKVELDELDKNYADLQEEHIKLRSKIKSYKSSFSMNLLEEKYCKHCQKPYTEATNFNWSCKIHASTYSEEMYWCCGQKGKEAPGCVTSKHVSSEDQELEKGEKDEDHAIFCSSCKNVGHTLAECPKDPNTRSRFDPNEELTRIEQYKKKKKMNSDSYFVKRKFINMVINRIKQSDALDQFEKNVDKEVEKEGFSDILKYKKDLIRFKTQNFKEIINSSE